MSDEPKCLGCADWCDCHNYDRRCRYCEDEADHCAIQEVAQRLRGRDWRKESKPL